MIKQPIDIPVKYKDFNDYLNKNLYVQLKKEEDCFRFRNKETIYGDLPFKFDKKLTNQVRCRIHVQNVPKKAQGIREFAVLKIFIETKNGDSLKKYEGYGLISKIQSY